MNDFFRQLIEMHEKRRDITLAIIALIDHRDMTTYTNNTKDDMVRARAEYIRRAEEDERIIATLKQKAAEAA